MSLQQVWWINWQHLCAQKQWTTTSTLTITTTWRSQNVSSVSACQQQQGSKWCLIWWWCLLIWIMVQAMSCVPSWICKLNRVCVHNGVNNDFSDHFCRSRVQKLPKAALKDNTTISESELWSTYFDPFSPVLFLTLTNLCTYVGQTSWPRKAVNRAQMLSSVKETTWICRVNGTRWS